MSFQAPVFLLGLLVVPLALAALALARRRPHRYVVRFPATATLAAVLPRAGRLQRALPPALLCLALAGLVIALARPEATVAVPVERASVVLVTDTSGSMKASDVEPTRLAAAKAAGDRFLDNVPDSLQVGLVAYADGTHTVMRPTSEHEQIRATLAGLRADGGTATGDALASALEALGRRGEDPPPARSTTSTRTSGRGSGRSRSAARSARASPPPGSCCLPARSAPASTGAGACRERRRVRSFRAALNRPALAVGHGGERLEQLGALLGPSTRGLPRRVWRNFPAALDGGL